MEENNIPLKQIYLCFSKCVLIFVWQPQIYVIYAFYNLKIDTTTLPVNQNWIWDLWNYVIFNLTTNSTYCFWNRNELRPCCVWSKVADNHGICFFFFLLLLFCVVFFLCTCVCTPEQWVFTVEVMIMSSVCCVVDTSCLLMMQWPMFKLLWVCFRRLLWFYLEWT